MSKQLLAILVFTCIDLVTVENGYQMIKEQQWVQWPLFLPKWAISMEKTFILGEC
jgi:hypothetical protein